MGNDFCRQIDEKMLVEEYVAGRLKGDLLKNFEEHIEKCEKHDHAVSLEKSLKMGISEFARNDIKAKLRKRLEKQNDTRFLILRYAAILLVAVITPLLIYYQFNIDPQNIYEFSANTKHEITKEESVKPAVSPLPEKSIDAEDKTIEVIQKKSRGIASGRGGSPKAQPVEKGIPSASSKMKTGDEDRSVKSEDIVHIAAEETSTSPIPDIAFSKARPRLMQGVSSISEEVSNLYADMRERTLRDSTRLKECIVAHIESDQRPAYVLLCNVQVLMNGEIGDIEVINASIRSDDLEKCLITIMKSWRLRAGEEEMEIEHEISYH